MVPPRQRFARASHGLQLPEGVSLPAFGAYRLDLGPFAGDLVQLLGLDCCISEPQGKLIRNFPDPIKDSGFAMNDGQDTRRSS
jgi:hypothetical protein